MLIQCTLSHPTESSSLIAFLLRFFFHTLFLSLWLYWDAPQKPQAHSTGSSISTKLAMLPIFRLERGEYLSHSGRAGGEIPIVKSK